MSTQPVVVADAPVPIPPPTKKNLTLLQKIGQWFVERFRPAVHEAGIVAQAAEPIVDAFLPSWAPLYNTTVQLVVNAEATATAAGAQNGSGPQKLAAVTAALEPLAIAYLGKIGIAQPTTAQIQAYINSVVAGLNSFEALSTAQPSA